MSKWANQHFAWVSPLLNFKKRLFSYKHKEVIANNGTNKGASKTKLLTCREVPLFHTYVVFRKSPKSGLARLDLKATKYNTEQLQFLDLVCASTLNISTRLFRESTTPCPFLMTSSMNCAHQRSSPKWTKKMGTCIGRFSLMRNPHY